MGCRTQLRCGQGQETADHHGLDRCSLLPARRDGRLRSVCCRSPRASELTVTVAYRSQRGQARSRHDGPVCDGLLTYAGTMGRWAPTVRPTTAPAGDELGLSTHTRSRLVEIARRGPVNRDPSPLATTISSEASCANGLRGGETNVTSDLGRFAPSKGEQQIWIANIEHVVLAVPFHDRYASRVIGER